MARSKADTIIKLAGSAPAITALRKSLVLRALTVRKPTRLIASEAHDLPPHAFTIKTTRESYLLARESVKIRLNLDICHVETPESERGSFSEAVLTLKKGDLTDLFQVARLFLEENSGQLRVSMASRPVHLLTTLGHTPTLQKISTEKENFVGDVLNAGLSANVQDITALAPMVVEQRSSIGLRKMRVALRRFRSLETLFRRSEAAPQMRAIGKEAAVFARCLGVARDWDVFVDETLHTIVQSGAAPKGVRKLRGGAEHHRMNAWQEAVDAVASVRFQEFLLAVMEAHYKISQQKNGKNLERPITKYAPVMLDRFHRKACECAADLSDKPPSAGHPLRLAIKKLRFSVRIFRDLYPRSKTKPYLVALAQLQDRFGILNDAVVAQMLAQQAAEGQGAKAMRASGFVSGYRGAEAQAAANKLLDEWATFETMPPFWREDR